MLLIGMLFVLLAADVRMEEVRALGWRGAATVAVLMFLVRPLNILAGTWGSGLPLRDKAFLAWLAPRGIVAAAVSSLFAGELEHAGIDGGSQLRALVFLVIAVTVLVQGAQRRPGGTASGGAPAVEPGPGRARRQPAGARAGSAAASQRHARSSFSTPTHRPAATPRRRSFRVLFGNALTEGVLLRADLDGARRRHRHHPQRGAQPALRPQGPRGAQGADRARRPDQPGRHRNRRDGPQIGARVLFGRPRNLPLLGRTAGRAAPPSCAAGGSPRRTPSTSPSRRRAATTRATSSCR